MFSKVCLHIAAAIGVVGTLACLYTAGYYTAVHDDYSDDKDVYCPELNKLYSAMYTKEKTES